MKVEVDETYCCDQVMKKKMVMDVDTKKSSLILFCEHCKGSIEIDEKSINYIEEKKLKTS